MLRAEGVGWRTEIPYTLRTGPARRSTWPTAMAPSRSDWIGASMACGKQRGREREPGWVTVADR